jgi:hypothetical protein
MWLLLLWLLPQCQVHKGEEGQCTGFVHVPGAVHNPLLDSGAAMLRECDRCCHCRCSFRGLDPSAAAPAAAAAVVAAVVHCWPDHNVRPAKQQPDGCLC